jgi:hypothetical protein
VYNESEIIGSTSPEIRTVAKKKKWWQRLVMVLIVELYFFSRRSSDKATDHILGTCCVTLPEDCFLRGLCH